jgi:hypothetical protein
MKAQVVTVHSKKNSLAAYQSITPFSCSQLVIGGEKLVGQTCAHLCSHASYSSYSMTRSTDHAPVQIIIKVRSVHKVPYSHVGRPIGLSPERLYLRDRYRDGVVLHK